MGCANEGAAGTGSSGSETSDADATGSTSGSGATSSSGDDSGSTGSSESESSESGASSTGEEPPTCPDPPADPPCEGTRCFYIDPTDGDDAGDGSFASPWRSFVNVNVSIYRSDGLDLQAGDVIYVREGTIDTVYHPGDDSGPEGGGNYLLYLRGIAGPVAIKRYPGERPVLAAPPDTTGVLVSQSSGILIDGLEVRDAWERGIRIEGSQDIEIAHVLVYDTDGTVADNVAGLEVLASEDVEIRDSVFADNYDHAFAQTGEASENSGNLVLFSNEGTIAIRRCAFYQTEVLSQRSGFGVKYKHAGEAGSSFVVEDSYFEGTTFGIGIGTSHADVHHNVIADSGIGIDSRDFGGPTHQWQQRVIANTIVADIGIEFSPTLGWIDDEGGPWPDVTENAVERNIVVDTAKTHHGERRTVLFNPYMNDALHDALASGITLDDNCYHWAGGAASFGFAEAEDYGAAGGAFDLAGWRAAYGFDAQSLEADPALAEFVPADASPCAAMGAFTDDHVPVVGLADPLACGSAARERRWE
jgi:hypothetical protein